MTDWLLSTLWYGSFVTALVAFVAIVKPMRKLGLGTRMRSGAVVAVAAALILVQANCAPSEESVTTPITALDAVMPAYQFREVHTRTVNASPAHTLAAIKAVTVSEIALFKAFTTIRRFGRPGPESILYAPEHQPILTVATRSGFLLLADSEREIVVGSIVAAPPTFRPSTISAPVAQWFRNIEHAEVVKATMNFRLEPVGAQRTRVTTETRVFAVDSTGLRQFTPYWRTIFPGSWILRVTWLTAIAQRAERASG